MDEKLILAPIAHIHTPFPEKFGVPRQSGIVDYLKGQIIFEKDYQSEQAVRGLEKYSHIWLIWLFSKNEPSNHQLTVRPPKLGGNKRVGVFASRSPYRPNPIGLSCVRLERIEFTKVNGPVLHVLGADIVDNTPIYDIKPYIPYTDSHPQALAGFSVDGENAAIKVNFPPDLLGIIDPLYKDALLAVLAQDPHPAYKNDANREYFMAFEKYEIGFKLTSDGLTVTQVRGG